MNDVRSQIPGGAMPFSTDSVWAMLPSAFENLRETLATTPADRLAAVAVEPHDTSGMGYVARGSVAVIPFSGVVTKRRTLMGRIFGGQAVAMEARAALASAASDPAIKSVLMVFDSPGGTVDGTADLADAVAAVNKTKPVTAYAEDLCASAAYWVASQAGRIVGNSTASVGSIGVFAAVPDVSRLAKNLGVEMHVVRSAAGKGAGTPGAPVTDSQLADLQAHVNAIAAEFVGAVSRGRGFDATSLADGRVHIGAAAVGMGLLDAVQPLDAVLAEMQAQNDVPKPFTQPAAASADITNVAAAATDKETLMDDGKIELKVDATEAKKVLSEVAAATATASADITKLRAELTAMKAEKDIDAVLTQGIADRKITPALLETARTVASAGGFDALKAFVASLPASAPAGGSVTDDEKTVQTNEARHPADHVGGSLHAFNKENSPTHQAAIAHMERAEKAGRPATYREALIAVTRKIA